MGVVFNVLMIAQIIQKQFCVKDVRAIGKGHIYYANEFSENTVDPEIKVKVILRKYFFTFAFVFLFLLH